MEDVSLGGGGLGAGTGALDGSGSVTVCGFGVMAGFSGVWEGLMSDPGSDFDASAEDEASGFDSAVSTLPDSTATPSSSQNTLLEGLGEGEKLLGFGAMTGGDDLAGCPWRRGRGRGSGLFVTMKPSTFPVFKSPQLSSATCCSNACILALRVAMSSSSAPSSLSDWLRSLSSLQ